MKRKFFSSAFINLVVFAMVLTLCGCGDDKPDGIGKYSSYCDAAYTIGGKYTLNATLNGAAVDAEGAEVTFDSSTTDTDSEGNPVYSKVVLTVKNIIPGQPKVTIADVPIQGISGGYSFKATTTVGGTTVSVDGSVTASYSDGVMVVAFTTK